LCQTGELVERPGAEHLGRLVVAADDVRHELAVVHAQGVHADGVLSAEPAPEAKVCLLQQFEAEAREVLGGELYEQLPPRALSGLTWGQYHDRLHVLEAVLNAKRVDLLD
jgi:hypothetical protein